MKRLNKEELYELKTLIGQAKAVEKTMVEVLQQSDASSHRFISCISYVRMYQTLADASTKFIPLNALVGKFDINNLPNPYDLTSSQHVEWFQTALASIRILISLLEANFDYIDNEYNKIENLINSKLRPLIMNKPEYEKDIQDNIERLFISNGMSKGIDYDRETGKFNFSGREYIPDFILPKINCCMEVKLIKEKKHLKKMIEEINADITAYSKKYEKILFVVYDLGCIRDIDEFKRDIEASKEKEIKVFVIKH
ncbi:MAG: hypothetical protein IKF19_05385 [Bacilli bacterium]|nr:hypothetical protein [Bacilli bacterium]